MGDETCVGFLQWVLPRMRMHWPGFRRVRGQVCKRLNRRIRKLGLSGPAAYRNYLEIHAEEWDHLDRCCRITISRFYRDRAVFDLLGVRILPDLAEAAGTGTIRVLSLGAAAGEEPFSLAMAWFFHGKKKYPQTGLEILAVEINPDLIRRAEQGCYPLSSLKELPGSWRQQAFVPQGDLFCLQPFIREAVRFVCRDVRMELPPGPWDLILCRNQAFTYFDAGLQKEILARIETILAEHGFLVLGSHETLPAGQAGFQPWQKSLPIFRKG